MREKQLKAKIVKLEQANSKLERNNSKLKEQLAREDAL